MYLTLGGVKVLHRAGLALEIVSVSFFPQTVLSFASVSGDTHFYGFVYFIESSG